MPHMGMTVLATHPDEATARSAARRVAAAVWDRRADLQGKAMSVADAVVALASGDGSGKPLLVLDVGDNIGGGGPGDSTVLLAAILARRVPGVVGTLYDPAAVTELSGAAVGDRVPRHRGRARGRAGWPAGHAHRGHSRLACGVTRRTRSRTAGSGTSTAGR